MYKYDNEGKVVYSYVYDSETYTNLNGTRVVYDDQSRVFSIFHSFDYKTSSGVADDTTHYNYNYNAETGNLAKLKADGAYFSGEMIPTYDKFGRTENKIIDFSVNGSKAFYNKLIFDYVTNADSESVLVSQLISQVGKTSSNTTSTTYNYTYDNNGNITQITNASGVIQNKYYYDALGQLVREDNRALNSTYTYSYDTAGNITSKKRYAFTTGTLGSVLNTLSYTYGDSTWKDLLTNYNGTSISYDTIGNPTSIGYAELTWQGRELTSYNDSESYELSFGYNADGIRTYKKVYDNLIGETFIHEYILNGTQIICEAVYYVGDDLELEERYRIVYLYDETGAPIGMKYREPSYAAGVYDCFFFEKNLQGDIIAVYNSNGTKLITYDYDAWGKCTTTYVAGYSACGGAVYNPFRYRGYYYDVETGWYYLQSRYYNPEWGRFLNADGALYGNLLGFNLFAYCYNDPLNYIDCYGDNPIAALATAGGFALADGPLPIGDIIAGIVAVYALISMAEEEEEIHITTIPLEQYEKYLEHIPYNSPKSYVEKVPIGNIIGIRDNTEYVPLSRIETVSIRIIPRESSHKINIFSKDHGKRNLKHSEYVGISNEQLIDMYHNPNSTKSEKIKIVQELKGRGIRNVRKRKSHY